MSSPQNGNGPATSDEEHVGWKNSNIGAATVCEIGVLFGISNESNLNLDRSAVRVKGANFMRMRPFLWPFAGTADRLRCFESLETSEASSWRSRSSQRGWSTRRAARWSMSKRSSTTLRGRTIAGAAVDVSDTEPLQANYPFRSLQNLLATSHIESVVENLYRTFCCDAAAISLQTHEPQKERQQRR
ncbi:NAD(P)-dependent oxidoreductase [Bradyrhizobium sp. AZCC 2289]|uniref:NAD(P)-dependent oxidoreductase n=1 Tax=Bradyrhizobium sp. AZCC 2289 TaxID=3117026 RepID=UPI002FF05078